MTGDLTCTALTASAVVLLLSLIYWYITRVYGFFNKIGIPGPIPSLPFGNWNRSARLFLGAEDISNSTKYGTIFGTFDGLKPNLLTTDPKLVKEILASDNLKDRRAAQASASLKRVLQILGAEDQKNVNTLLNSSSNEPRIAKLATRLETATNALIRAILKDKEQPKVTINGLVADYIQDISALVLLGIDLNQDPVFRQSFLKHILRLYAPKNASSPLAILPHLYGGDNSWIIPKGTLEYFRAIISPIIKERTNQETVESKAADFVDILLEAAKYEKQLIAKEKAQDKIESAETATDDVLLTDNVLADQILAALLILNHWTKSVVIFGVHALACKPDIQEKLHEEVKVMEGASYDIIQSLPYLDMFISEVLRCHTPEFRLEKIAIQDFKLKEDIVLQKGTLISIPLFALHQSKEIFETPAEFKPERFAPNKADKIFLPYGQAGDSASSIALQLGIFAAKLALLKIVKKLNIKEAENLDVYVNGVTGVPLPADIDVVIESRV